MKKVFLSLAIVAALTVVSCKEKTEEKVDTATEAVGQDMHDGMEDAGNAIDSTATKVGEDAKAAATDVKDAAKEGVQKVEEKAKEVKKEMK